MGLASPVGPLLDGMGVRAVPSILHLAFGESLRHQQFVTELCEAVVRRSGLGRSQAVISDTNRALLRRTARLKARTASVRLSGRRREDRGVMARAVAELGDLSPQLVHAHGFAAAAWAEALARRYRVPWAVSVLSAVPDRWAARRLVRRAAAVATLNLDALPEALRAPATEIPGGLDKREFVPSAVAEVLMSELGLNPYTLHLGLVGQFDDRRSGWADFLEAAAQVARRVPLVEFVIVGSGREAAAMERCAHQSGILGNTRFLGLRIDRSRIYHALDAVVLPSHETLFPWELLEAAAAGAPIIATDIEPHRRLAAGDPSVTLYPVGDTAALAAHLLAVVEGTGPGLSSDMVDLSLLGGGLHGVVRARISQTHYNVGDDELEELVDPDAPDTLRRRVMRDLEITQIAKRYEALWDRAVAGIR